MDKPLSTAAQSQSEAKGRESGRARATCGGKTRGGAPCRNPAGFKTDHVGVGRCAHHAGATRTGRIAATKLQAKAEAARLGAEVNLDPADALGLSLRLAAGEVEWLRGRILQRVADDPDADLSVLAPAHAAAVERLARISKLASDAGIAERSLELDEAMAGRVAQVVSAAAAAADLTPEQAARFREALTTGVATLNDLDWRRPAGVIG